MKERTMVIGAGFAGLAAACYLAKEGAAVSLYEKNESAGGRASMFETNGFKFDMGPSWYWMPDVFESFFNDFGKSVSDYYDLKRLDPGYRLFFGENDIMDIPAEMSDLIQLFEAEETGAGKQLIAFLKDAAYKYDRGINDLINKPALSIFEFANPLLLKDILQLDLFSSVQKTVQKRFKSEKLRKILEFPAYFLGATPDNIPALYTLMNHADLTLGTWYPMGGMHEIIKAMESLALELGVEINYNSAIQKLNIENGTVVSVLVNNETITVDKLVAAADYHHVEQKLIPAAYRNYSEKFWDKQVLAPSALIFYLGVDTKLKGLLHHNLFFDKDFKSFGEDIYKQPKWPNEPLFYVCCPSQTDPSVAPEGSENLFILMPTAPDLVAEEGTEEHYFNVMLERLEQHTKQSIRPFVSYKKAFTQKDFKTRYNSLKGNAYGLANTLTQTAFFKPKMINPKIKNMAFAGQLTVPGPGVPPSLISGKLAAEQLVKAAQNVQL